MQLHRLATHALSRLFLHALYQPRSLAALPCGHDMALSPNHGQLFALAPEDRALLQGQGVNPAVGSGVSINWSQLIANPGLIRSDTGASIGATL